MNYETFVLEMVKSLVVKPQDVVVKTLSNKNNQFHLQVLVNSEDLGRIIGRKGRIANSIRTIVHACAARNGHAVEINIEALS